MILTAAGKTLACAPLIGRFSKLLLVLGLTFSLGLHWILLQSVAWMSMVVDYSRSAPFHEAVAKALDGEHPCKLCKFVRAGQEKEKKQEFQKPVHKFEFLRGDGNGFQIALLPYAHGTARVTFLDARGESPPTPPPRIVLG
jgi:hypothetical protein